MKKIILAGKFGKKSTLATLSYCDGAKCIQRFTKKNKNHYYKKYINENESTKIDIPVLKNTILIRWGTRMDLDISNSIVYNDSKSIKNASNKAISRDILEKAGVRVPNALEPFKTKNKHLPIIARPHVHSQGKDFIVLDTKRKYRKHYNLDNFYYSNFIDKDKEFRVHCAHGKVLRLLEKPKGEGMAWNHFQVDDPFEIIKWSDSQPFVPVMLEALKAVKALELDFGAVDVISKDGVPYVLEVNTAPSIDSSEISSERWGKYFNWLFKSNERREHFDFTEWEKGKSFFFKNQQLDA